MDADRDLNFAIGWNRFNLGLVGIWPDPVQGPGQKGGLSRCRFLTASFFMLGFMCIPQTANLFFIWGNADMMTENLATANIPVANSFMKAFTIWHHRKALKQLVKSFYQDWYASKTSGERTIMLKSASVVRKISVWCTVLTQTMVTIYIVLRISMITKSQRGDTARPMMYTAYFPFDINRSPIFEVICVCQILSAYSATVSYTGSDSFISMLVLHVCGQFQNLQERLKNLVDNRGGMKTVEDFRNELAQIVKRHEHLNWFAKTIEDSFNVVLLVQIFSCTVQLCFQGFQVFNILINGEGESLTFQLFFLVMFVAFILAHLYVYCYVGEMLLVQPNATLAIVYSFWRIDIFCRLLFFLPHTRTDTILSIIFIDLVRARRRTFLRDKNSGEMGFSAYKSNWFNIPGKEARNLLLTMHRSTAPLCLTAGKFGVFSLQLFSKIVKTSLGYLSVLLTVTDRN